MAYGNEDLEALLMEMMNDPEMAKQIAQMSAYGDRMGLAGQQAKRAQGLLGTPSAEGRQVGNTYVASSPLEHLGVLAERGVGARQLGDATGTQQGLIDADVAARQKVASGIGGAFGGGPVVEGSPLARAMQRAQARYLNPAAQPGQAGYDATAGFDDPSNY